MISVRKQPLPAIAALVVLMVAVWMAVDFLKLQLGEMKPLVVLGIPIIAMLAAHALERENEEKKLKAEL